MGSVVLVSSRVLKGLFSRAKLVGESLGLRPGELSRLILGPSHTIVWLSPDALLRPTAFRTVGA